MSLTLARRGGRTLLARIAAVVALGIFLGACSMGELPSTASGAWASGSAQGATSTSEPTPEVSPVEATEIPISVAGDERTVRLFVPDLDPDSRAPLWVLLHGWREAPSTMEVRVEAGMLAAREKVIVALPPGRDANWHAGAQPGEEGADSRDVVFLAGMLDRLVEQFPVDPQRIYVGGFSIGAVMTDRLGCQLADRVSAIAVVSGGPWSTECDPERPVSVLVMHGSADSTFRIDVANGLAERWRTVNHCPGEPDRTTIGEKAIALTSGDCADDTKVEFVTVQGQGHVWFDAPDATQLAWQFLNSVNSR
jgi:polyhydroxybutyrate depolymerase